MGTRCVRLFASRLGNLHFSSSTRQLPPSPRLGGGARPRSGCVTKHKTDEISLEIGALSEKFIQSLSLWRATCEFPGPPKFVEELASYLSLQDTTIRSSSPTRSNNKVRE
ncbi:unnamed protein product [Protopolystoma xenopodis]|uniref:Uncharacterized protein n=1 Tax=Protopolystoma xenopodis TaxID=117903 RepID=A0A3S5A178_9PLAT|nr:unnamed protein product [Protopolystoma xenopodis]